MVLRQSDFGIKTYNLTLNNLRFTLDLSFTLWSMKYSSKFLNKVVLVVFPDYFFANLPLSMICLFLFLFWLFFILFYETIDHLAVVSFYFWYNQILVLRLKMFNNLRFANLPLSVVFAVTYCLLYLCTDFCHCYHLFYWFLTLILLSYQNYLV